MSLTWVLGTELRSSEREVLALKALSHSSSPVLLSCVLSASVLLRKILTQAHASLELSSPASRVLLGLVWTTQPCLCTAVD